MDYVTASVPPGVVGRRTPRILRLTDLSSETWARSVEQSVAAGFDTVLVPNPDLPPGFADCCVDAGISIFADVTLDHAASEEVKQGDPFASLLQSSLDPRDTPARAASSHAAVANQDDGESLARWWGSRLAHMQADGIHGVRLLGLADLPEWSVPGIVAGLRAACPGMLLFGWTPGLSWSVLERLQPGILDLVASSLPWWDGRTDWLWRELAHLRRIAPVVAEANDDPASHGLAAVLAEGWMATARTADAAALNRARDAFAGLPWSCPVSPAGVGVVAVLRTDTPDPRRARRAALAVTAVRPGASIPAATILAALAAPLEPFAPIDGAAAERFGAGTTLTPPVGRVSVYTAAALEQPALPTLSATDAETAARQPRVAIEAPSPCVDAGRFPARQIVGTEVVVSCDVITDGHDQSAAVLRWQPPHSDVWQACPMTPAGNDRWTARFPLEAMGTHLYVVEAWRDAYATFVDEVEKKHKAGVSIVLELQEGAALVLAAEARSTGQSKDALTAVLQVLGTADLEARRALLVSMEVRTAMASADDRPLKASIGPFPVQAERLGASFASWYEVFPRSMSDDQTRHGTFRDVVRHLPRVAAMGFDVLYFPPFHPIGRKNRKGPNNTLTPGPNDPGSPYAIGSDAGGHDALHPELGTLEDLQHLRAEAAQHGIELAMDFAIQCSPDHPWLKQHPGWFNWRPDGSIRYAENPPKKYEDIVNVDFYAEDAVPGLWMALAEAVMFWASQGIRLFRVDNPHTKPLPFWEWMIAKVQARYPDAVFLAEAFTRPKVMYRLAKVGFSQSYTYFTWRNSKREFQEYLTELAAGPGRDFFRPHFFVNTPDINPVPLQNAPRSGFLTRAALAATLSGLWGVYNGFELCDATPIPGREEYLDSEKYQIRKWDWNRPGNIVSEISRLNAIRKVNPAFHSHLGVTFLDADDPNVLLFEKATPDRSNVILVAINMDLHVPHSSRISVPFWRWVPEPRALDATDLLHDRSERWTAKDRWIQLTADQPYAIWRIAPAEAHA